MEGQTTWACPGSATQRSRCPEQDTASLSLTVLIWEMGINTMSANRVAGELQGEGRLVALARGLSLLWVPQLSPPGPELCPWSPGLACCLPQPRSMPLTGLRQEAKWMGDLCS